VIGSCVIIIVVVSTKHHCLAESTLAITLSIAPQENVQMMFVLVQLLTAIRFQLFQSFQFKMKLEREKRKRYKRLMRINYQLRTKLWIDQALTQSALSIC
jgi:hypothetical protein